MCPFAQAFSGKPAPDFELSVFTDIDPNARSDLILYCRTADDELGVIAIQSKSGHATVQDSIQSVTPGLQFVQKKKKDKNAKKDKSAKPKENEKLKQLMSSASGQSAQKHWMRIVWSSAYEFHRKLVQKVNHANRDIASTQPVVLLKITKDLGPTLSPVTLERLVGGGGLGGEV